MAKTFECYIMESAEAERIADELTALEAALQSHRNTMALGCVCVWIGIGCDVLACGAGGTCGDGWLSHRAQWGASAT